MKSDGQTALAKFTLLMALTSMGLVIWSMIRTGEYSQDVTGVVDTQTLLQDLAIRTNFLKESVRDTNEDVMSLLMFAEADRLTEGSLDPSFPNAAMPEYRVFEERNPAPFAVWQSDPGVGYPVTKLQRFTLTDPPTEIGPNPIPSVASVNITQPGNYEIGFYWTGYTPSSSSNMWFRLHFYDSSGTEIDQQLLGRVPWANTGQNIFYYLPYEITQAGTLISLEVESFFAFSAASFMFIVQL